MQDSARIMTIPMGARHRADGNRARAGLGLFAAILFAAGTASTAAAPLVLQEQGTFHVGGSVQFRDPNSAVPVTTGGFVAGDIAINHMFVEYQIPYTPFGRAKLPLIMVHGGGHTAKTYETTPDGREGWFTTFARRGYPVYAVDAPNRGRSGYDPTHRYKVLQGLEPASAMETGNIYSKQGAWTSFRFGPTYGVQYPGQRFPFAYLDEYVKELVPSYRDAPQNGYIVDALVALIDKLGPCILIGHSTGGANVLNAVTMRPNLVKAVVGLEPAGFPPSNTLAASAQVPTFLVVGDNRTPDATLTFTQSLAALGGDATTYWLPEHGIFGNGHMMMMENNSEQIADLVADWIQTHAKP